MSYRLTYSVNKSSSHRPTLIRLCGTKRFNVNMNNDLGCLVYYTWTIINSIFSTKIEVCKRLIFKSNKSLRFFSFNIILGRDP